MTTIEIRTRLAHASKAIEEANDNGSINHVVEELVTSFLGAEFSSLWYYHEKKFQLRRERHTGTIDKIALDHKKGIIYKCFMTKESKLYNYLASDKDYVASIDNPDAIKIKSKIMLPLLDNGEFIGILTAYNSIKNIKKFSKTDVELLKQIAPIAIEAIYAMHHTPKTKPSSFSLPIKEENEVQTQEKELHSDDTLTFVANFVHDIRTPANTLYGFLDILESQIEDERLKTYLYNAKESANFINELTTSVLNMVSTHKESITSDIQEVDSIHFFSSVAKSFASNMSKKGILFNIYIDPLIPKNIRLDTLKMKRVILNLIGNAYKFTPNNHTIEFSVRYISKTNRVVVYIKDTGIGIPKEKQSKIFEAFKQAEETTALNYGGTGLGLFISAKYVKEMGGTLALISEVDKGSTFSFDIALHTTNKTPSYTKIEHTDFKIAIIMDEKNNFTAKNIARYLVRMGIKKENLSPHSSFESIPQDISHVIVFQKKTDPQKMQELVQAGIRFLIVEEEFLSIDKKELCIECDVISQYGYIANKLYQFINIAQTPRILIVDDDAISVRLLLTILENDFCEIVVAKNGKEALDMVIEAHRQKQPFSLVYIDNNMPIMSGVEAMKKIREFEKDNNLKPLYAVSTSGDMLTTHRNYFDIQVSKPFKKESIREILYEHI